MKKLRWGVIGAGGIADRRTIPGMMLAKNAELIAVMDINAEQVEKIRQKYGAKRGYTKEEDLLADPEVDGLYRDSHRPAREAGEAGCRLRQGYPDRKAAGHDVRRGPGGHRVL